MSRALEVDFPPENKWKTYMILKPPVRSFEISLTMIQVEYLRNILPYSLAREEKTWYSFASFEVGGIGTN
jgi:hypothetical protein